MSLSKASSKVKAPMNSHFDSDEEKCSQAGSSQKQENQGASQQVEVGKAENVSELGKGKNGKIKSEAKKDIDDSLKEGSTEKQEEDKEEEEEAPSKRKGGRKPAKEKAETVKKPAQGRGRKKDIKIDTISEKQMQKEDSTIEIENTEKQVEKPKKKRGKQTKSEPEVLEKLEETQTIIAPSEQKDLSIVCEDKEETQSINHKQECLEPLQDLTVGSVKDKKQVGKKKQIITQEQSKLDLLKLELKQVNGQKVSAKTQKDEKQNKSVHLQENMDEEGEPVNQEQINSELNQESKTGFTISTEIKENGFSSANGFSSVNKLTLDSGLSQKINGFASANGGFSSVGGFSSAKGVNLKTVGISLGNGTVKPIKAGNKFESMFEDLSDEENKNQDESVLNEKTPIFQEEKQQSSNGFLGLKTASNNKKLEVDEKKLNILYQQFLSDDEEQDKKQENNYDNFFQNKPSSDQSQPFVGFKTASKTGKELKINPEKLQQLEKAFNFNENNENENNNDQSANFTGGFATASENKKLYASDEKMQQVQSFMIDEDEEDILDTSQLSNTNGQESKQLFKDNQQKNGKKRLDLSTSNEEQDNQEDQEQDNFAKMLKLISKKPEAPKRDRPKPFRQVSITDLSKAPPVSNSKATPSRITSANKQNNRQFLQADDPTASYLFNNNSDKKSVASGKSSLSKPFSKPQSTEKWNEDNEISGKKPLGLFQSGKGPKRYQLLGDDEEDGKANKAKSAPSSVSKARKIQKEFQYHEIPDEYSKNQLIKWKYQQNRAEQGNFFKKVTYQELILKKNITNDPSKTMDIETAPSQTSSASSSQNNQQQELSASIGQENNDLFTWSHNINECLKIRLPCTCKLPTKTEINSKSLPNNQLECFCNGQGDIGYMEIYNKLKKKEKNVDSKWVRTHFRMVSWKLACYTHNLLDCPINKTLNINNLYNEIEFRLYSEIYGCRRSVLKQIAEQDAVKSLTMVLIVVNIIFNENLGLYLVELSDGWYSVFVVVFNQKQFINEEDYYQSNKSLLLNLITKNKIKQGSKLYINSLALPPVQNLEKFIIPNQDLLHQKVYEISYNNITLAPENSKLGIACSQKQKYFPRSLKSLRPFGGSDVQTLDVFIIKKYPLCFEAGLVKRAFCNKKQTEDEGIDGSKTIGFTILVADALLYHDSTSQLETQPWAEVNVHQVSSDLFESLKEGTRIRLYNVKINNKGQAKSKFDWRLRRCIGNVLYFDTTKKTKIEEMSSFVRSKEEQIRMRNFGLELGEKYRILLDEVEETVANIDQSDKEVLLSQIQILKFELDVVIYVVKCEDGCYFGIDQNYSAVCITPSKEIRNSSSSSNQLSRRLDNDFSAEDSYLYEKLNKAREQVPAIKIEKVNIPSPDEGKIAVFHNVSVDTIKNSSLSTSDLNMFLFSFSFNSSKKIVGLTDQLNGIFPDRYKEPMNALIESVKLASNKFQEVTCFLRNNC